MYDVQVYRIRAWIQDILILGANNSLLDIYDVKSRG